MGIILLRDVFAGETTPVDAVAATLLASPTVDSGELGMIAVETSGE